MIANKNSGTVWPEINFILFVPCIVNSQFTSFNKQNAKYSSVDIYVMIPH